MYTYIYYRHANIHTHAPVSAQEHAYTLGALENACRLPPAVADAAPHFKEEVAALAALLGEEIHLARDGPALADGAPHPHPLRQLAHKYTYACADAER